MVEDYLRIVGINIIIFRGPMTQQELADKAGVNISTVQTAEKGEAIALKSLLKIAIALDINPADLFITKKDREHITYKTKVLCDKLFEILKIE